MTFVTRGTGAGRTSRRDASADDGGWDVDWAHWSPAGALDWRGWATVRALRILRANARV
jgi:hypothetical protein